LIGAAIFLLGAKSYNSDSGKKFTTLFLTLAGFILFRHPQCVYGTTDKSAKGSLRVVHYFFVFSCLELRFFFKERTVTGFLLLSSSVSPSVIRLRDASVGCDCVSRRDSTAVLLYKNGESCIFSFSIAKGKGLFYKQSFVGLAFHGVNDSTFRKVVYFRFLSISRSADPCQENYPAVQLDRPACLRNGRDIKV